MLSVLRSSRIKHHNAYRAPIILIYQYFVHKNIERQKEIVECLRFNVSNINISQIILLNEKIYSKKELGVESSKILQIDIKKRMQFSDVFDCVERLKVNGYIITCNADIFFNNTLSNLYKSGIHKEKSMFAQNRFEYNNINLLKCKLNVRVDSQDTWIFHSNFNINKKQRKVFKLKYGVGGCDNKVLYLFKILGFDIKCDPYFIKTFHNHKSDIRSWVSNARVNKPYMNIIPYIKPRTSQEIFPLEDYAKWCGSTYSDITNNESIFSFDKDKYNFDTNFKDILDKNIPFLILHADGYMNSLCYLFNIGLNNKCKKTHPLMKECVQFYLQDLKKNGLDLNNIDKIRFFSKKYIELMQKSHISLHNSPWARDDKILWNNITDTGTSNATRFFEQKSNTYILRETKKSQMIISDINVINIGDYITWSPVWCENIRNKKILIISKYHKLIKQQIEKNVDFYNKPIFENCKYIYHDIPTNIGIENINKFVSELQDFDIVLMGETPYYFLIAENLNLQNKSVISMGTRLPLLYGLYQNQDIKNNKDIITLFMTKDWKNF